MPSSLEWRLEALARAVELMRPVYLRIRSDVESGVVNEAATRLSKKEIIKICRWKYGWWVLYNKLVDKFGLYHLRLGPHSQRNYTFKASVLDEIVADTTSLLPDRVDQFLDHLIAKTGSGGRTGARSPRRLAGVTGSMALTLTKDRAEANEYLQQLSTYAMEVKANLGVTPAIDSEVEPEMMYIDDIYDLGQGDPFAREYDVEE